MIPNKNGPLTVEGEADREKLASESYLLASEVQAGAFHHLVNGSGQAEVAVLTRIIETFRRHEQEESEHVRAGEELLDRQRFELLILSFETGVSVGGIKQIGRNWVEPPPAEKPAPTITARRGGCKHDTRVDNRIRTYRPERHGDGHGPDRRGRSGG